MKVINSSFLQGRRVLLTGHTGFKGAWMSLLLENMGANVIGVSLSSVTEPCLYNTLAPWKNMQSIHCDIRDRKKLSDIVSSINPEIVIHMAAQALVRESYQNPVDTLETNVMGTIYLLEALRSIQDLKAVLVITSDKVYNNRNDKSIMSETNSLGGHDPYSASKAATELVTASYAKSFFDERHIPVATARAGNVIGGGDWAKDRIIPDLWRAYTSNKPVNLRYPNAVRPWQHVLDPLFGYLLYLEHMVNTPDIAIRTLNFGPSTTLVRTVLEVAQSFSNVLEADDLFSIREANTQWVESNFLFIDPKLAKLKLGWDSALDVDSAIHWTCKWYKAFRDGENMRLFSNEQIRQYYTLHNKNIL